MTRHQPHTRAPGAVRGAQARAAEARGAREGTRHDGRAVGARGDAVADVVADRPAEALAPARPKEGVRPGVTAAGGRIVGYPMPEVISSSLEFGRYANYPCRWR